MHFLNARIRTLLSIAFCALGLTAPLSVQAQQTLDLKLTEPQAEKSNEWVVVLKDPRPARLSGFNVKGYSAKHYASSPVLKRYGKRVSRDHSLGLKKAWFIESLNVYCLIVDITGSTDATLKSLEADERVEWVQPSNNFSLLSSDAKGSSAVDTHAPLDSFENLGLTANGEGVNIALIDSAVANNHPDLAKSIAQTHDLVVGSAEGLQTRDMPFSRGERHGTAMAGILVASPSNDFGLKGVAPEADVYAYRGCWELDSGDTQCNTLSLARALDGVAQSDASILNLSLSGPKDLLLDRLVDRLVKQGVVIVAAFDPNRPSESRFPSRRDGVLIVRAEHMNQDFNGEFTAPGKRIVVSPTKGYSLMTGHSVAAAYTSGVLALIVQKQGFANAERKRKTDINSSRLLKAQLSRNDVSSVSDLLKVTL